MKDSNSSWEHGNVCNVSDTYSTAQQLGAMPVCYMSAGGGEGNQAHAHGSGGRASRKPAGCPCEGKDMRVSTSGVR